MSATRRVFFSDYIVSKFRYITFQGLCNGYLVNVIETREYCIVSKDHWTLCEGIAEACVSIDTHLSKQSSRTPVISFRYDFEHNGHHIEQIVQFPTMRDCLDILCD
jgi:hypothetical protein